MTINSLKTRVTLVIVVSLLAVGVVYAAITLELWVGTSNHIGLWNGPAKLTARTLKTPIGGVQAYSVGQAFETSEGRVHRAYNLGDVDAVESNMFVGPPGRPITVFIPGNERRCGPPSTVDECKGDGWASFNFPSPFANQGQCIEYVNHRARITLLVPEDPLP